MSAEIKNILDRSGIPCPFKDDALCTAKCDNHIQLFSISTAASLFVQNAKLSGEKLTQQDVEKMVGDAMERGLVQENIKPIDCAPTYPDAQ